MLYRAYVEGFTGHFNTVQSLKDWASSLLIKYPDLRGKEVQIWKATWLAQSKDAANYSVVPNKVCVLGE